MRFNTQIALVLFAFAVIPSQSSHAEDEYFGYMCMSWAIRAGTCQFVFESQTDVVCQTYLGPVLSRECMVIPDAGVELYWELLVGADDAECQGPLDIGRPCEVSSELTYMDFGETRYVGCSPDNRCVRR